LTIDTDKYEGTNWDLRGQFTHTEMADEVLLLLAEVKRLRKVNDEIDSFACLVREYFGDDLKELYDLYNSEGHNHLHRLFTGEEE